MYGEKLNMGKVRFRGQDVLVTWERLKREQVHGYVYEMRHGDETDWSIPVTIERGVWVNRWGALVTNKPLTLTDRWGKNGDYHIQLTEEEGELLALPQVRVDIDLTDREEIEKILGPIEGERPVEELLQTPIEKLGFSSRLQRALERWWYRKSPSVVPLTLEPLINLTEEEFMKIRNLGEKSHQELKETLRAYVGDKIKI